MTTIPPSKKYCLTSTIDNSTTKIGQKYYHNIKRQNQNQVVLMRPRLPLRYDFNDVDLVKIKQQQISKYNLPTQFKRFDAYRLKRTNYNLFNTFLLYLLSVVVIIVSIINMKKIFNTIQDVSIVLSPKDALLFRIGFVLSFISVAFLFSMVGLSIFELFRNQPFKSVFNEYFQYNDINIVDGNVSNLRSFVIFFTAVGVILAFVETLNMYAMEKNPKLFILFAPISACIVIYVFLYQKQLSPDGTDNQSKDMIQSILQQYRKQLQNPNTPQQRKRMIRNILNQN